MNGENGKRIQWHPAFCSAMRLELIENKDDLDYINEYNLSVKPLQVDLLVICKKEDILIQNEIGKLFRGHNITEYKSPDDGLNVDTYYKVLAYAYLYKSSEEHVDSIKAEDITISLIRESYPRKLMKFFKTNGYVITNPYEGIYYVKKDGFFDTQVIVSRKLQKESHTWIKALTDSMKYENAKELIEKLNNLTGNAEKEYGDSILDVAMKANPVVFGVSKKEDGNMCEALRELMKPELDAAKAEVIIRLIEKASKNSNISIEAACNLLEVPVEEYQSAKALLEEINTK